MTLSSSTQRRPLVAPSLASICAALLFTACAPDIAPDDGADAGDAGGDDGGTEQRVDPDMTHTPLGDATQTVADSTDEERWIRLDLDEGKQVDATDSDTWELSFKRFNIAVNGGESGAGDVEVKFLADLTLDDVTLADADGGAWTTDAPDGDDEDGEPDLAFGGWYAYDPMTHILTPQPGVYLVRAGEDRVWAVEILDYYNAAGTSGHFTILWRALS